MDHQWEINECRTCIFAFNKDRNTSDLDSSDIDSNEPYLICRKNPPNSGVAIIYPFNYPLIRKNCCACSCWRARSY